MKDLSRYIRQLDVTMLRTMYGSYPHSWTFEYIAAVLSDFSVARNWTDVDHDRLTAPLLDFIIRFEHKNVHLTSYPCSDYVLPVTSALSTAHK